MNQIEITFEGTLWTQPYNEHRYSPGRGVNVLERARTTLSVLRSEQCVRKGGYIPACTLPVTQPSRTRDRIRCNSSTAIPPHPDHRSTLQTPSISLAACKRLTSNKNIIPPLVAKFYREKLPRFVSLGKFLEWCVNGFISTFLRLSSRGFIATLEKILPPSCYSLLLYGAK